MLKAIIFDKDGILIDSEKFHVLSVSQAFNEIGIKLTKKDLQEIGGRNIHDSLKQLLKKYSFEESEVGLRIRKIYLDYKKNNQIRLINPAIKLLKESKKLNLKVGLCTNDSKSSTEEFLEKNNLKNYFDVVVCADSVSEGKPNPEIYLVALKRLNVKKEECIAIEDSLVGVRAAVKAGIKVFVVPRRENKEHDFPKEAIILKSAKEIKLKELV